MKFATVCALTFAAAYGAEIETETESNFGGYHGGPIALGGSYGHAQAQPISYGKVGRASLRHSKAPAYGREWVRRSTVRPRDVKAYNAEPVDAYYYKDEANVDETIIASCEFDFQGFQKADGRIELKQEVDDLTSLSGEFDGIKPGQHLLKIHELGDLEWGCQDVGSVFNPFKARSGESDQDILERRVGDIMGVKGNKDGAATYYSRDLLINLSGPNSVMGRAMVLYDDSGYGDEPAACCVIGLAEGEKTYPTPVQRVHLKGDPKTLHGLQPQISAHIGGGERFHGAHAGHLNV